MQGARGQGSEARWSVFGDNDVLFIEFEFPATLITQTGQRKWAAVAKIDEPTQKPTTSQGGTFSDFSSSSSKYRIRPAAEWNPSPFFFAMLSNCRY